MTKKDFELIARAVQNTERDALNHGGTVSLAYLRHELASALATTNPAFNRERFLTACGVSE